MFLADIFVLGFVGDKIKWGSLDTIRGTFVKIRRYHIVAAVQAMVAALIRKSISASDAWIDLPAAKV